MDGRPDVDPRERPGLGQNGAGGLAVPLCLYDLY
jgi:hypothetical protein